MTNPLRFPFRERDPARPRFVDTADPAAMDDLMGRMRPAIPADRALLCMDCDSLFEAVESQTCPACGSRQAVALGRVLGRAAG